jgi:drug/metabolite transporter (DMT)-like permease
VTGRSPDTARQRRQGLLMLAVVVVCWGLTWPVHKAILETLPPLWLVALRNAIGAAALFALVIARGRLVAPARGDLPILFSITLLHIVGFSLLMNFGLQRVSTGRSVVLAYTTPLWVTPGAALFLGERVTRRRMVGVLSGLLGLIVLFNPLAFDWSNGRAIVGNAAILLAALMWAANIVHLRGHRWRGTAFDLIPWELLLATVIVAPIALASGRLPAIEWDARLVALLLYSAILGSAVAYWAMAVAGRLLPAVTTSLGLLATPLVSIVVATLWLRESVTPSLVVAGVLILGGVALGTVGKGDASG